MNSLIFGSILAFSMLMLYAVSIGKAIFVTWHCDSANCPQATVFDNGGYSYILNLIGGLISAAVIGALTLAKPNAAPGDRLFDPKKWTAYIPTIYICVWILCGLLAVYFGILEHNSVQALTAQGKAWLGAAVAAVYAYFGVNPNNGGQSADPANRK